MPKTALDIVGKGYRSISPGYQCPSCLGHNTYFSCSESAWVCFDCGEVFSQPELLQAGTVHSYLLTGKPGRREAVAEDAIKAFSDLRARLTQRRPL